MHFKISYYYAATGETPDSIPATHVEAESQDKAIFLFWQDNGRYQEHTFKSFMQLDPHVREWGLTVKPWRQHSKKGAGRPKGNATIQINKRVPWQHYDNAKVLLDALVDCPSMIPDLLAVAKAHSSQRPVRNHPHKGTVGN